MKKRIEKVVEFIDSTNSFLTKGKWYTEIPTISFSFICVRDNDGRETYWDKERFKVVSEREVWEFEWVDFAMSDIDRTKYDLKVIATPKEKGIEYWKEEAEKDVLKTPVSVLRYISALELKSKE